MRHHLLLSDPSCIEPGYVNRYEDPSFVNSNSDSLVDLGYQDLSYTDPGYVEPCYL